MRKKGFELVINHRKITIFIILAFLILVSNLSFMTQPYFEPIREDVAFWSFIDIALVLPLFFYFLIVRKQNSSFIVIPFIIACFWLAYLIIPKEYSFLEWVKNGFIGFEILFVLFELYLVLRLIRKIPEFKKNYINNRPQYPLFLPRAFRTITETFKHPRMLYVWLTEVSVFYYITSIFRPRGMKDLDVNSFTFHKKSGYFGVFIMFAHALLIEIIGVHFMLVQVNYILAWVVTALDIYTLFYLIADYRAITLSPAVLKEEEMHLQKGIRRHFVIRYSNIAYFGETITPKSIRQKEKGAYSLVFAGIEKDEPKFEIQLKEPLLSYSFYGIKKTITKFYITPDEPAAFKNQLQAMWIKEVDMK